MNEENRRARHWQSLGSRVPDRPILTREEMDRMELERQHYELSEIQADCLRSAQLDWMAKIKREASPQD